MLTIWNNLIKIYGSKNVKHSSRFIEIVKDAKSRIKEISMTDFKQQHGDNNSYTLIDVREESEWLKGNIPGAIHLGKGIIERDIEKVIPDTNALIILYCGGGSRSALSADNLQKMGYNNVYSLESGYRGFTT